jgi:branched-subunit amino acid transport protein
VLGPEILGVLLCVAVVAWRRNLFLGLVAGVGFVALARLVMSG